MLKVTTTFGTSYQGFLGSSNLLELDNDCDDIESIRASGEELKLCCKLLGRSLPPTECYIFRGNNAKEIADNWSYLTEGKEPEVWGSMYY